MHEFRVWAPGPSASMSSSASGDVPMTAAGGGWRECRVAGRGTGHRLRVQPGRRPAPARSPLGLPARGHPRAVPRWSTTMASPGPTAAGAGCRWPGRSCTSATSARSPPRAPSTGRSSTWRIWPTWASDTIELMPVAEFSGDRGWGYDGVDLFAPHHAYGGPDGLKRLVDAAHEAGLGVVMDVVYNHLGPAGNYLPEFGPYFSARHQTNWGDGGQLRRARQRRGPALRHRQRPDVAARLPLRRAAPRRRARHRRRLRHAHPGGARRRGGRRWPLSSAARCS